MLFLFWRCVNLCRAWWDARSAQELSRVEVVKALFSLPVIRKQNVRPFLDLQISREKSSRRQRIS